MLRILSIVASVSLLSMLLTACTEDNPREREENRVQARNAIVAERDTAIAQATAEFTNAHKGDEKWQTSLEKQKLTIPALQQSLMRPGGQAIVARVSIVHATKEGERFRLLLKEPNVGREARYNQTLIFDLKCALPDGHDSLRSEYWNSDIRPDHLVAARIHEVQLAERGLLLYGNVHADVPAEFIATGECLGLKGIGSIYRSYATKERELTPYVPLR